MRMKNNQKGKIPKERGMRWRLDQERAAKGLQSEKWKLEGRGATGMEKKNRHMGRRETLMTFLISSNLHACRPTSSTPRLILSLSRFFYLRQANLH